MNLFSKFFKRNQPKPSTTPLVEPEEPERVYVSENSYFILTPALREYRKGLEGKPIPIYVHPAPYKPWNPEQTIDPTRDDYRRRQRRSEEAHQQALNDTAGFGGLSPWRNRAEYIEWLIESIDHCGK